MIQNTIKLTLAVFILLTSCSDEQVDEAFYQYASVGSDEIVPFEYADLQLIKENLYISGDTLYLGTALFEDELDEKTNAIESKKKGMLVFNTIRYNLSIDTGSYTFLINDQIAMDAHKLIAFPKGNYKLPCFEVLKLNPKKLIPLKNKNTYLKDDQFVYCVTTNTYIDVESNRFETELRDGVVFGKVGNQYFYLDEPVEMDDFLKNVN